MKDKNYSELLKKVKDSINIVEVIGEHVVLRQSGANFVGLCPFHAERTPSFSVNPNKQLFHCYGCNEGGDLIHFAMSFYALSFPEAVEELAERARIQLPAEWKNSTAATPEAQERKAAEQEKVGQAFKLNRFVALYYNQMLARNGIAKDYFQQRGVNADLIKSFYLGAATSQWDALAHHLIETQAPLPLALELGLIKPSTTNLSRHFDLFRNRVLFPILDLRGKVNGFGGRLLPAVLPSQEGEADGPKYLNSPESPIFHKGKLAFGLYQAQKYIREKDEVILVEGYFDVMALHAAGFRNAVATCGTALTPDHLKLFSRFTNRMVILFDGDKAGVEATERAMSLGLKQGVILYGASMPSGMDPDEILFDQVNGKPLRDGQEQLTALLQEAKPILDSRIEEVAQLATAGPEAKTQALKQIGSWLAQLTDPLGREVRLQSSAKLLEVSRQLLEKSLHASGYAGSTAGTPSESTLSKSPTSARAKPASITSINRPQFDSKPERPREKKLSSWERMLFSAFLQDILSKERGTPKSPEKTPQRVKFPPHMAIADYFDTPVIRSFVDNLLKSPESAGQFVQSFLHSETNNPLTSLITEILVADDSQMSVADPEELEAVFERANSRMWQRFSREIRTKMTQAEVSGDMENHTLLMKEYLDIQRRIKEIN